MTRFFLPVGALMLGIALMLLGNGLFSTFIALRMTLEGFATSLIGLVVAGYSVGFLAGCIVGGRLIRRIGHIRAFAVLGALTCCLSLSYPFLIDPYAWIVLRTANGYCAAGMFMIAESWLNARTPTKLRGRVLALYTISNKLAFGGGQLLLLLADPAGPLLFMTAAFVYSLSLVPVAATTQTAPTMTLSERVGIRRLYELSPLGVVGCILTGLIASSISGMAPVFAAGIGLSTGEVAQFMAFMVLGGLGLQWPIGWLTDRYDRRSVLLAVVLVMSVMSAALAVVWQWSLPALYILFALHGGLLGALYPICVAHTNDFVERRQVVSVSGSLLLLWAAGAATGPAIASQIMAVIGPTGLFWFVTLLSLALAGFIAWRMSQRAGKPADEQGRFVPQPAATPVAAALQGDGSPEDDAAAEAQAGA
ncbi:MAG: MFS transporter [Proteobacteria bacterium]|nr:MFS transporter [Pseudomonadota bacterium]MBI3495706.1 MFS transporter [Pseudomonadota bacterium]